MAIAVVVMVVVAVLAFVEDVLGVLELAIDVVVVLVGSEELVVVAVVVVAVDVALMLFFVVVVTMVVLGPAITDVVLVTVCETVRPASELDPGTIISTGDTISTLTEYTLPDKAP